MELIARHFISYPPDSPAFEQLDPLIRKIGEVRFPVTVGERNSNQLTYDFDSRLEAALLDQGAIHAHLKLPTLVGQKYDFAFKFNDKKVVVEVEKANWEKILRDLLKFHIYFKHGADFAVLFLPRNYPHSHGEPDNFKAGQELYMKCLDNGFGQASIFNRILLVGYEQATVDGERFTSAARNRLKVEKKNAIVATVH